MTSVTLALEPRRVARALALSAAAVVADGTRVLSSVVSSQIDTHRKYGGVVPELASRDHIRRDLQR